MNYYKDKLGNVYAYDDEAIKDIVNIDEEGNEITTQSPWTKDKILMTPEEVEAHINPQPTIEQLKSQKLTQIEKEKDDEQSQPVQVRDLFFFGGRESGQKYKEAFELALLLGKTTGEVAHTAGLIEVDEAYMKEILTAVGLASYQAWYKATQRKLALEKATTKEEIEVI